MKAAPVQVAHCSTCGTTLNAKGECLACLVRVGFDCLPKESPDSVFGDYEIARRDDGSLWELGRGAMGVTYRAEDKVLNRSVALKVVAATAAAGAGQAVHDRFLREARAAAAFRHPNVAGVFHFGASSEGDRCYYAMELVAGETLEALVRRDGPLQVKAALEMAVQVTRALVAAAAHGLVHRDLKPGNIMLTRSGSGGAEARPSRGMRRGESTEELEVKIIDFGLAKAVTDGGNETDLTRGAFVGTPAFASPEQFSGAPADARSDIYSLGATLWYALTSEVPYEGKTIDEIHRRQTELALSVHKLSARKVPRPVIQLLRRTLALNPAERPASAHELMEALELCRARLGYARPNEWSAWPAHRKLIALGTALALATAAFVAFRLAGHKQPVPISAPAKSIAVLPFQNMSDDKQNAYFADGVQEEILTTLAKVADLKVISRTSVMQFRDAEKRSVRDIAQQLGVAHVLEGSVQRSANRIRVTAKLIDARTDAHVWGDRYDGDLVDVFAIQTEIAQKIAGQLKAALSPNEQAALQAKPTVDPAAYDLYLRAREIERGGETHLLAVIEKQITLLEEGVARDPAFLPALCMLAQAHMHVYWFNYDHTPARLELARRAIDAAARLRPDAGEVHLARAVFHYHGSRDYAPALAELALAARNLPNDANVLFYIGAIERRQGRWEESTGSLQRATVLDPRNANLAGEVPINYLLMRRYQDVRRVMDDQLAWKPEDFGSRLFRAYLDLYEKADLGSLQNLLWDEAAATADQNIVARNRRWVAYLHRDYRAAEQALSAYRLPDFTAAGVITPREYYDARAARGLGDTPRAEAAFLRARERAAANVAARPDDGKALIVLAKIDTLLGRKEEAVREGEHAVGLLPVSIDAFDGPHILSLLAEVYAGVGKTDRALDVLQQAATLPGGPTYGVLQLDEDFDPLRKDPRFEKILGSLAPKSISR
jgi:TolB-like protein